jgi:hypothetical protein
MKNLWLPLVVGAVGSLLIFKYMRREAEWPGLVTPIPSNGVSAKNFGAFPIDIPEKQFDEFFV